MCVDVFGSFVSRLGEMVVGCGWVGGGGGVGGGGCEGGGEGGGCGGISTYWDILAISTF